MPDPSLIDVDGIKTRYFEMGAGTPVVLIHGGHFGLYYSAYSWSLNWHGLARNFRVVAFDRLGMGDTENPTVDEDYTMTANVKHAKAFLEKLGLDQFSLVGHSRGAYIAAKIALDIPDRTTTLVVVDSNTLSPYDPNFDAGKTFYNKLPEVEPGRETLESVRAEPTLNSYSPAHITQDFVEELLRISRAPKTIFVKKKMKALYNNIFFPELETRKKEITSSIANGALQVPTLIMWGLNDPSAPVKRGWELFESISRFVPASEFHVFNRAGHYSFREHPEEFNLIVEGFVGTSAKKIS